MRLQVKDIVGRAAITLKDGQELFDLVHPELLKGGRVQLDFSGVEIFASPFFNAGIGQLLSSISASVLNAHLHIEGLSDLGVRILREVIENAKEYYSSDASKRAQVDAIVKQTIFH